MNSESESARKKFLQGSAGLVLTILIVAILLIALPSYRWFFVVSVGIGLAVAGILYLWHKLRPLKEEDVVKKRPLGL